MENVAGAHMHGPGTSACALQPAGPAASACYGRAAGVLHHRGRPCPTRGPHPALTLPVPAEHAVQHAHEGPRVRRHERLARLVPQLAPNHRGHHHGVRMAVGLHSRGSRSLTAGVVPSAPAQEALASRHGGGVP